jgi:threonylcarbamoyladenosine tRNA methylthiotransferase MtaB
MRTFHLTNFGCRASQADGAALERELLDIGLQETAAAEASDIAVLNTCTVTAAADAEVRQVIRRIHRANPRCRILVTGCYAQRAPHEIAALGGVAWVVGNSHKHHVAQVLRDVSSHQQDGAAIPDLDPAGAEVLVGAIDPEFHFAPASAGDRTRPTLKIQDGCDARCAFCIIPSVRGRSRSLPPDRVIGEMLRLHREGYKEVILSGINLGGYGRDLGRSINFRGLLERILAETDIARLRISSIEPMDVSPETIRLAAHEKRLADHFHVPLQSGSDRILRLMNRRYWTSQYAERVLAIREMMLQAAIGADVMVGFPGETHEDFRATAEFVERLPFTYLHVFPFSARPGTPAAAGPEQVEGRIAHERVRELRGLIAKKHQAFLESQVGHSVSALTLADGSAASGGETLARSRKALSSNYLPVSIEGFDLPANVLFEMQVGRVCGGQLYGYQADVRDARNVPDARDARDVRVPLAVPA